MIKSIRAGLIYRIQRFSPIWFTVNMGTGAASTLMLKLPFQFTGQRIISEIIFFLNCILLIVFTCVFVLRFLMFPKIIKVMIYHPLEILYIGTMPMGFATAINYVALAFPNQVLDLIRILFYMNLAFSVICATVIPYVMFTRHSNSLETINAVMLQPIVSLIICAAVGSVVGNNQEGSSGRTIIYFSYFALGLGIIPNFFFNGVYLTKLIVYGVPNRSMIFSSFLPIGPHGQGTYALINLAIGLRNFGFGEGVFDQVEGDFITLSIYAGSLVTGIILFAGGFFHVIVGSMSIIGSASKERIPFSLGYWGCTFSLSTMASASNLIFIQTQFLPFKVVGSFISILVLLLWLGIFIGTAYKSIDGSIFISPAFDQWKVEQEERIFSIDDSTAGVGSSSSIK